MRRTLLLELAIAGFGLTSFATAAPRVTIPQDQMDQLHNFFRLANIASDGLNIYLGQPPASPTPEAQKMAQMLGPCQTQHTGSNASSTTSVSSATCPINYFSNTAERTQISGVATTQFVERNKINSFDAQLLTGLKEYSSATATTVTPGSGGVFTSQGTTQKRLASADGGTIVQVQITSGKSGVSTINGGNITQTVSSDKEDYTINYNNAQTYTAEIYTTGGTSTCTLDGVAASCEDFDYVMGVSSR